MLRGPIFTETFSSFIIYFKRFIYISKCISTLYNKFIKYDKNRKNKKNRVIKN